MHVATANFNRQTDSVQLYRSLLTEYCDSRFPIELAATDETLCCETSRDDDVRLCNVVVSMVDRRWCDCVQTIKDIGNERTFRNTS